VRVRYTAGSFLYVDVDMFHHWTLLSRPTSLIVWWYTNALIELH
jgi:hypothetical protein